MSASLSLFFNQVPQIPQKPAKKPKQTVTPAGLDDWCRCLGDHWLDFLSARTPIISSVENSLRHAVHINPEKVPEALKSLQNLLLWSIRVMRGDPPDSSAAPTLSFGYRGRFRAQLKLVERVVIGPDMPRTNLKSRKLALRMRQKRPTVVVAPATVIAINGEAHAWSNLIEPNPISPIMLREALSGQIAALADIRIRRGLWSLPAQCQRLAAATAGTGIAIAIFRTGIFGPAFQAAGDASASRFQVVEMILRADNTNP